MTVSQTDERNSNRVVDGLVTTLNESHFRTWYQERELRQRIRDGNHYDDSHPAPNIHRPSRLLQCHRKTYYEANDTPRENRKPVGIFWIGNQFETDIALPFLRDVVPPNQYVRNSVWIDFTVESTHGDLQFRGTTDPVIVDKEGTPILVTEIKTTSSFVHLDEPKPHHKAQVSAYLYGVSETFDVDIEDAVIIYSKRNDFELRSFHVSFDSDFWNDTVLDWAARDTAYRKTETLPPPDPEFEWECSYCSFRQRCGQANSPHADAGPDGLLPLTHYPRLPLVDYLESHSQARLTPTLSYTYPDLHDDYGSYDWECNSCRGSYPVSEVDWNGDVERPPFCPSCGEDGVSVALAGPSPNSQLTVSQEGT